MQSIYQAWGETKQSNKPSDDLLSTTLIDIWLALGYQGGKAARKDQKLLLLRSFRDKLVCGNQEWYNNMTSYNQGRKLETLTIKEKDGTQFDSTEAYNQIITVLEKEFENHECINLLTWERTPPPPSKDAIFREKIVMISTDSYKSGQTTIYDLLDHNISDYGSFCGEPSKYLVFSYANPKKKLLLLRTFRDKLIYGNRTWFNNMMRISILASFFAGQVHSRSSHCASWQLASLAGQVHCVSILIVRNPTSATRLTFTAILNSQCCYCISHSFLR